MSLHGGAFGIFLVLSILIQVSGPRHPYPSFWSSASLSKFLFSASLSNQRPACWCLPVISTLRVCSWGTAKFQINLGYVERPCFREKQNPKQINGRSGWDLCSERAVSLPASFRVVPGSRKVAHTEACVSHFPLAANTQQEPLKGRGVHFSSQEG